MKTRSSKWAARGMAGMALMVAGFAAAGGVLTVFSRNAVACGGLFCNSRPPDPFAPLPVAQTGENVVFAIDKDPDGGATTLVAHIQILYAGDAAKFSWVVPVDSAPTLSVGTDRLFSTLASVTQPQFSTRNVVDGQCIPATDVRGGGAFPTGPSGTGGSASSGAGGATGATAAPAVNVSFQGAVGPYDAAVIQSEDPAALKMWLADNGYVVSDQAAGLIDGYVRDGKFFVALKLLNGLGVKAIQPIVLTFKATEPCIPLKLTAIAANPDMQVRMWVLADRRAVPKNFYEMKVDDARIDWLSGGSNYNLLVKQAADEAGGNAFVTEYAGTSAVAARSLWAPGQYDLTALKAAMTPPAYVAAVTGLGLANDAQTLPLLATFIPMPAQVKAMGITDSQFYGNLSLYWSQYSFPPFDLPGLTAAITDKIIEPRRVAQSMLDVHPYLTRLNTFISPQEMNVDALFIINRGLPDVPLLRTAVFRTMCGSMQFMACNAPIRLELPDGRMAWVRSGIPGTLCGYHPFDLSLLQKLPAADVAWQREEIGEGTKMVDNGAAILAGLQQNNNAFPAEQKMFPLPTQGPGATTGGPSPGDSGGGGAGQNGCACALIDGGLASAGGGGAAALLVAMGLGFCAARRRRSSRWRR